MKKMRYLLVLFLALGMLGGCGEKGNGWFDAEVIAVDEDSVDEKAGIIKIVFQIYKYGDDGELTLVSNPIRGQVTEEIGVLEEYSSPK